MVIVIILVFLLGVFAGWRAGIHLMNKKLVEENQFLKQYVEDLKLTISYWSSQANYNKEVHNSTIVNHNSNLNQTLSSLLHVLQNQNNENMKATEKEQVENIIKTIKGGISSS